MGDMSQYRKSTWSIKYEPDRPQSNPLIGYKLTVTVTLVCGKKFYRVYRWSELELISDAVKRINQHFRTKTLMYLIDNLPLKLKP